MLSRKLVVVTIFTIWTSLYGVASSIDLTTADISGKELLEIVSGSSSEGEKFIASLSKDEYERTAVFAEFLQKNMVEFSDLKGDEFRDEFIANILDNRIETPKPSPNSRTTKASIPDNSIPANFAYIPMEQGMDFGTSLDLLSEETKRSNICFDGNLSLSTPIFRGVKLYKIKVINSISDLQDALNISGSISLEMNRISGKLSGLYETYKKKIGSNVLVSLSVEYQAYDFNLLNPGLSSGARAMFGDADLFTDFRIKCGDRYLSTITTGGIFIGLLEIMTQTQEDKRDIGVALEGKIDLGAAKVEFTGEFNSTMKNIQENHNTRFEVYSKGGKSEHELITTVDQFYAAADTFLQSLNTLNDASTPYQEGAYLAKFSPYESITITKKGGDIIIKNARMEEYRYYASVYDKYLYKIDYIQRNFDEYQDAEEKDVILRELTKDLIVQKSKISGLARVCALPTVIGEETPTIDEKCPAPTEQFEDDGETKIFLDEWDILEILPLEAIKYPRTCQERKEMFQLQTDGTYRVYMEGNKSKPYDIYCDGMATDNPQEYLTLKNLSPVSDHPSYNYSRYSSFYTLDDLEPQDLVSIYSKLKVKVSYDHLAVYDEQDKFVETVGSEVLAEKTSTIDENTATYKKALFGNARNSTRDSQGEANVNSAGTQFRLSENTTFVQLKTSNSGDGASYKLVTDRSLSWTEAETYAQSLGGHLVTIDSASKNLEVMEFIKNNDPQANVDNLWIGLNALQFENQLEWATPNKFYDYGAWAVNQPSNDTTKNCVMMDTTDEYRWSRTDCSEEKRFLVEFSSQAENAVVEIDVPRTNVYFNSTGENGNVRSKNDLILEYY